MVVFQLLFSRQIRQLYTVGFCMLCFGINLAAQSNTVDSLIGRLKTSKLDSNKVNILNKLSVEHYYLGEFDKEMEYAEKALQLSKKIGWKKGIIEALNNVGNANIDHGNYKEGLKKYYEALALSEEMANKPLMATCYNYIGNAYFLLSNYSDALKNHHEALKLRLAIGDKVSLSASYSNMGNVYIELGDFNDALKYLFLSLKIDESLGDKWGVASGYNNIGIIHSSQGNNTEALKSFTEALKIRKEINDKLGIIQTLDNLGITCKILGDYNESIKNHEQALAMNEKIGDKLGLATSYNNLGNIYLYKKEMDKAHIYFRKALALDEELGRKMGIAGAYSNLGIVYINMNNPKESKKMHEKALQISKEIRNKSLIQKSYFGISMSDSALYNYKGAYENYKMYALYSDSLKNEDNIKKTMQQKMQYEFDKKTTTDSVAFLKEKEIKDAEIAKQKAEIKIKQNQQFAMIVGLLLIVVFTGFIYNRFKVTQKQKYLIEAQKEEVEQKQELLEIAHNELTEKNKEITDSINYAKRIQEAILPSIKTITDNLNNGFVLFKPKDVVSGDFYWIERTEDTLCFAAADSTGHGVPGAMVSVICSNALTKAFVEDSSAQPGKLLDRTREIVIQNFAKSGEDVKDGMDISLCKLSMKPTKKGKVAFEWAGANNPIWIIRKGAAQMEEIKANKQAIGKTDVLENFTTHFLELQKGDAIYIFTDGIKDQFGGGKGKKFKAAQLKELLLSIKEQEMHQQKESINQAFENWKGNYEQVDDVCMIGWKL